MNCGSLGIHLQGNEENNFAEVKEMYPNTYINMMHNLAVGFNPHPPPPPPAQNLWKFHHFVSCLSINYFKALTSPFCGSPPSNWNIWRSQLFTFKLYHIYNKTLVFSLERLDTSSSNYPPQPGKVWIPHPTGTDNRQMLMGCMGGRRGMLKLQIDCCNSFKCLVF